MLKYCGILLVVLVLCPTAYAKGITKHETCSPIRASWYGEEFDGKPMASGKIFESSNAFIAAHLYLPLGTKVAVTRCDTNRTIIVWIMDRGPYREKDDGVLLDLSEAAARKLRFIREGLAPVHIEILEYPYNVF